MHPVGAPDDGGVRSVAEGVIPAGQTTATLSVTTPCFAGQVDIKFVFVLDTQPQGRVGGPWIQNGTGCTVVTTTTTATTIPTTPTTTPTTTGTTVVTSPTPPPSTALQQRVSTTLPTTGGGSDGYNMALVAVAVGALLIVMAGARRTSDHTD